MVQLESIDQMEFDSIQNMNDRFPICRKISFTEVTLQDGYSIQCGRTRVRLSTRAKEITPRNCSA